MTARRPRRRRAGAHVGVELGRRAEQENRHAKRQVVPQVAADLLVRAFGLLCGTFGVQVHVLRVVQIEVVRSSQAPRFLEGSGSDQDRLLGRAWVLAPEASGMRSARWPRRTRAGRAPGPPNRRTVEAHPRSGRVTRDVRGREVVHRRHRPTTRDRACATPRAPRGRPHSRPARRRSRPRRRRSSARAPGGCAPRSTTPPGERTAAPRQRSERC